MPKSSLCRDNNKTLYVTDHGPQTRHALFAQALPRWHTSIHDGSKAMWDHLEWLGCPKRLQASFRGFSKVAI